MDQNNQPFTPQGYPEDQGYTPNLPLDGSPYNMESGNVQYGANGPYTPPPAADPAPQQNTQYTGYAQNQQYGSYDQNQQYAGYAQNQQYASYGQNQQYAGYDQSQQYTGYAQNQQYASYGQNQQYAGYDQSQQYAAYGQNQQYAGYNYQAAAPYGYDPYTGEPLTAPAAAPEPPKKKRGWVKFAVIGVIVVVIIALAAILIPKLIRSSVSEQLSDATTNSLTAIRENSMIGEFSAKDADSIGLTVSVEDVSDLISDIYGSGNVTDLMDIEGSLAVAVAKGEGMSADLNINAMGLEDTISLYAGNNEIVLGDSEYLSNSYGLVTDNLEDALEDSIFNPDSGSDYALDEYTYDSLIAYLEAAEDAANATENTDEITAAAEQLSADIKSFIDDSLESEVGKETVSLGDADVKCTVITVTLDGDKIADLIELIADSDYMDHLSDLEVQGVFEVNPDNFEDLGDELSDFVDDMTISFAIYKNYLVRVDAALECEGGDLEAYIDLGSDPSNMEAATAAIEIDGDEAMKVRYRVKSSDADDYREVLTVSSYDTDVFEADLQSDRETGEFTLEITQQYGSALSMTGTLTADKDSLYFAPETVEYEGQTLHLNGITFAITIGAEVTKPDEDYINILKMDDGDVQDLTDDLSEALSSLYS